MTKTKDRYLVNAQQSKCIGDFQKLRNRVFAFDHEIGADLAIYANRAWKRDAFAGLRDACEFLTGMLEAVVGSYDLYEAANILSSRCMAAEGK